VNETRLERSVPVDAVEILDELYSRSADSRIRFDGDSDPIDA
jgi:hypothetical protein